MAFIPTPNTARVALEFSYSGQECVITLWFEATVSFDATSLTALAASVRNWAVDNLLPILSAAMSLVQIRATAQDSSSAPSIVYTTGLPESGGDSSAGEDPQVAAVASFRTDLRGRSYRGRNYVPGITVNARSAVGLMSTTFVAALAAAYAALSDVETDTDTTHVVVSHYTGGAPRAAGVTTPITEYIVDQPTDTQRRRSYGRGA